MHVHGVLNLKATLYQCFHLGCWRTEVGVPWRVFHWRSCNVFMYQVFWLVWLCKANELGYLHVCSYWVKCTHVTSYLCISLQMHISIGLSELTISSTKTSVTLSLTLNHTNLKLTKWWQLVRIENHMTNWINMIIRRQCT